MEGKLTELTGVRVKAAACRVLLATVPANNRAVVDLLAEDEETLEHICACATDVDPALRCYATGVLAVALRDRSIADAVVNMETAVKFLKRARMYASKLDRERQAALKYMQENMRAAGSRHKKKDASMAAAGNPKTVAPQRSMKRKHPENGFARVTSAEGESQQDSAGIDTEDESAPATQTSIATSGGEPECAETAPDAESPEDELKRLVMLELMHTLDCIGSLGEYQELLAPALKEDMVATIITFLHSKNAAILSHTMKLTSHFLAHRKFAFLLIETGGVELLFSTAKAQQATGQPGVLDRSLSMCIYGLASSSEAIERILTGDADGFLSVAFGLLSSPNDRARQNAIVFFSLTLCFKLILEYFEKHDGLYTLFNIIRVGNRPKSSAQRQLAHDACLCLRQYLRVHMALVTHRLQRRLAQVNCPPNRSTTTPVLTSAAAAFRLPARVPKLSWSKPVDIDDKAHEHNIVFYEKYRFSVKSNGNNPSAWSAAAGPGGGMWPPAAKICHLRGVRVMLEVVEMMSSVVREADSSDSSAIRVWTADRALLCLESLRILTLVVPTLAHDVCSVDIPLDEAETVKTQGISVLLDIAMSSNSRDSDLVREALVVFCNCVFPPHAEDCWQHPYKDIRQFTLTARSMRTRKNNRLKSSGTDVRTRNNDAGDNGDTLSNCCLTSKDDKAFRPVRRLAREKNAIKVCVQLLKYRRSVQNADAIRLLATRALLGLARDRHISQILEQMQIGQLLSDMIRTEPVLEENADVHVRFRECALDLISHVTHRAPDVVINEATDPTVRKIEKASIVANTKVTFNEDELMKLIHEHLLAKGMTRAASALLEEAQFDKSTPSDSRLGKRLVRETSATSSQPSADKPNSADTHYTPSKAGAHWDGETDELQRPRKMARITDLKHASTDANEVAAVFSSTFGPIEPDIAPRLVLKAVRSPYSQRRKRIQAALSSPHLFDASQSSSTTDANVPTTHESSAPAQTKLDEIITDYLREQHRQCSNPVTTVPPFRLLGDGKMHRCPDRPTLNATNVSMCTRILNRGRTGYRTGKRAFSSYYADAGIDRFVFSRYRPYRAIGSHSGSAWSGISVACFFGKNHEDILLGNHEGELRRVNIDSDDVVEEWSCHSSSSAIISLETNERTPLGRQNPLILSGTAAISAFGVSEIALWDANSMETERWRLGGAFSPQFNHFGDRIVALDARDIEEDDLVNNHAIRGAIMVDTATGSVMCELSDPMRSNGYGMETNCCFSPSDGTILTDGMLWDARIPTRALYKFDKLSNVGYGYFHPNGNEIIVNSAIWDLRTYRLLRVVPALDRCNIKFNHTGNVLYSYYPYAVVSVLSYPSSFVWYQLTCAYLRIG